VGIVGILQLQHSLPNVMYLTVAYQLIAAQHSSFGDRPITTLDTEVASWLVS